MGLPLSYDDYAALPEDGNRYEVLDGELVVSPAPIPRHQRILGNLHLVLEPHVRARRLGRVYVAPIDVILAPTTVVQPDLVFVAAAREAIVTHRAIEGPPDLLIEILSPGTARRDRGVKAALYARYGVPHYWIVDPDRDVLEISELEGAAYRLVGSGTLGAARTRLFPDLMIELARVFE